MKQSFEIEGRLETVPPLAYSEYVRSFDYNLRAVHMSLNNVKLERVFGGVYVHVIWHERPVTRVRMHDEVSSAMPCIIKALADRQIITEGSILGTSNTFLTTQGEPYIEVEIDDGRA